MPDILYINKIDRHYVDEGRMHRALLSYKGRYFLKEATYRSYCY